MASQNKPLKPEMVSPNPEHAEQVPGTSLATKGSGTQLSVRQTALQTESDAMGSIDAHIADLCRQMGQSSDVVALTCLRAEIRETEARRKTAQALFSRHKRREQQLMAMYVLYTRGRFQGQEMIEIAAQIAGVDSESLSYHDFRSLMLDKDIARIAEQVAQELDHHEREQRVGRIHRKRTVIQRRIEGRRRGFADRIQNPDGTKRTRS